MLILLEDELSIISDKKVSFRAHLSPVTSGAMLLPYDFCTFILDSLEFVEQVPIHPCSTHHYLIIFGVTLIIMVVSSWLSYAMECCVPR